MPEKELMPRKIEFDRPVTESQLQNIILDSIKELGLHGEWHFEHGYAHDNLSSAARCEKLHGLLRLPNEFHAVTEFRGGPWIDAAQEPVWGNIEFLPEYGCTKSAELYPKHIDRICETFKKYYDLITMNEK